MAHLFFQDAHTDYADPAEGWLVAPLDGDSFALDLPDGALVLERASEPELAAGKAVTLLQRSGPDGGEPAWVALARSRDVTLNGRPLRAGIGILAHGDELRVDGQSVFVSFERKAEVEVYPAEAESTCSRCRSAVMPGQSAVCCPSCGVWSHQDDGIERPCWP